MNRIDELKSKLVAAFNALPEARQKEITTYYGVYSINSIIRNIKDEAQGVIDLADSKMYGYGEVGYYLNEAAKEFAEETPELEKEYKSLIHAYFDMLVEAKEA